MAEKNESVVCAVFLHDGDGHIDPDDENIVDSEEDEIVDISAHYYAIYTVSVPPDDDDDVDVAAGSSSSKILQPLATLSLGAFPSSMSFACIGSCIYMFGGWFWKDNLQTEQSASVEYYFSGSPSVTPSYTVYIFDTAHPPPNTNTNTGPLMPEHLHKGPPLNTLKDGAYSVSLLGKIFAIPTSLEDSDQCTEFLDPSSNPNQWQCIPNPKIDTYSSSGHVYSCEVLGSYIRVMLSDGPPYVLDATNPQRGWKQSTGSNWFEAGSINEVVDGLLCTWFPVQRLNRGTCFRACSLTHLAKWDEFVARIFFPGGLDLDYDNSWPPQSIRVPHPSRRRMGGEIICGERKVIDIGDGRAAIVTSGFTGPELELHLVLDIVRLEKRDMNADGSSKGGRAPPPVEIIPLKSIDYMIEIGKPKSKFLNICGYFLMMGGACNHTSAACVNKYIDMVAPSRFYKRWDRSEAPFFY